MTVAIKRVHSLPPHLSYVSTLPNITQKPKRDTDELTQRLIDTWDLLNFIAIDLQMCKIFMIMCVVIPTDTSHLLIQYLIYDAPAHREEGH